MNIRALFVSHAQAAMFVKPGDGAFDMPAQNSQSTSMFRIAARNQRAHLTLEQLVAMRVGIVCPVRDDEIRPAARTPALAAYGWYGVDKGYQLGDVVLVGAGDGDGQRNTISVRDYVVLGAGFAPIGGVRACLAPPKTARTLDESTMARSQSIWSALCSLANSASWTRCHTPSACHKANRRQHVIPHPQPSSLGSNSHCMPVRSTKRIPIKAMRLGTGGRPRVFGGLTGGRSGSIIVHSSSGKIVRAICSSMQPNDPLALCKINRHCFPKL